MTKFTSIDHNYFEQRNAFAKEYGYGDQDFWFAVDNWPLLAGIANIGRFLAVYELIKQVKHLPGHFAELGCWHGTNLTYIAKLLHLFDPHLSQRVFGFDSFEGLKTFNSDQDQMRTEGQYIGSPKLLGDVLQLYNLDDGVEIVQGDIQETLPAFLEKQKDIRFAFVYIDVDLYLPTKVGVELLYPRLLKGGIMVFDEYNTERWPGETSAVHEVLGDGIKIRNVPFTRQPTAYIVK